MPRTGRIRSATKIYHVMVRGNNRQAIFHDREDYGKFISLLKKKIEENSFVLYAWCLMPNHVHLLLKEKQETISDIFKSVLSAYLSWYNYKYERHGHLFESRFKSRPVEDETYFLRVVRYIHQNPRKAGLCERMEDYAYSSYAKLFTGGRYQDDDLIFDLMRKKDFEQYHREKDEDENDFLPAAGTAGTVPEGGAAPTPNLSGDCTRRGLYPGSVTPPGASIPRPNQEGRSRG